MRRPRKAINQINVVPYIDVMLVLLVIFMVTAPLVNPGTVDLPSIGEAPKVPVQPLEVTLKTDKTLLLQDREQGAPRSRFRNGNSSRGSKRDSRSGPTSRS